MTPTTEMDTHKAPSKKDLEMAYAAILDGEPIPASGDPEVISRAIVERILGAETFEEAFSPQELKGWQELVDVPVRVLGFKLNPSTAASGGTGPSVYAVVDLVVLETGEQETVTCGGRNVLAQLVKALEKGWLGNPIRLIAKPTAEGNTALWLQAVPEEA